MTLPARWMVHVLVLATPASLAVSAEPGPGFSDIVRIAPDAYFVVIDRKSSAGAGDRFAIAAFSDDALRVEPLSIADWPPDVELPDDLEACCLLPGKPGVVLAAESGMWKHRFGRVFQLALARHADGGWIAHYVRLIELHRHGRGPYARPLDAHGRSYEGSQVEAMAAIAHAGQTFLLYAERGGVIDDAGNRQAAQLIWGTLDPATAAFTALGAAPLVGHSLLDARDCSALHVIPDPDEPHRFHVLSVATADPDTDTGPFTSVLFRAGTLAFEGREHATYQPHPADCQQRLAVASLKVEGLAAGPGHLSADTFVVATDDEALGGVIRAVQWIPR